MFDENTLRSQTDMLNNMTDDQLRSMAQMQGMNIDPQLMRQSAAMMKNMPPDQLRNMTEMAKKMQSEGRMPPGMGGMGMPNYGNQPQNSPSLSQQSSNANVQLCEELEAVKILKDCGNLKFKEKNYEEAEKLYNEAILKLEDAREQVPANQKGQLKLLETTTLLNLSNIKAQNKDYTTLLNLSKSIVLISPDSGKGYYRYAEALFHLGKHNAALEKIKLAKKYAAFSEIDDLKSQILEKTGGEDTEKTKEPEEIDEIKEERIEKPTPTVPSMPTMPTGFNGMPPVNLDQIDDSHLDMMKGMMSTPSGREMMRNMMKSQSGMDLSDDQLQMMSTMMNKDTLKMAQGMGGRPGFGAPGFNPMNRAQTAPIGQTEGSGELSQNMGDPSGMGNMEKMMQDMQSGGQPSMDSLMKNKDMMKMTFNMLKTNPAMIRSVTAGLGDGNPVSKFIQNRSDDDLKKLAVWLERAMNAFMFCYPAIKLIRENFRALMLFIVLFLVYKYLL